MQTLRGGKAHNRPRKEAFFVRVPAADSSVSFFNATEHLGQEMPFAKPQATCAMRASADSVVFSLLHLTKRTAANIVGAPVEMPRGPLSRLERKASQVDELAPGELTVEINDAVYKMIVTRDDNGVASVEMAGDEADVNIELPMSALHLSLYFRSPVVPRTVAVGFIGHLGKPGAPETVTRAASMVLFSITQLVEFRILSGIETVRVPSAPGRWTAAAVRKNEDKVQCAVPVWFFSNDLAPLGSGHVGVAIDLDNANPSSGRLLCHYTPDEAIAEVFTAQFRNIFDMAMSELLRLHLGEDELATITYDIVLGDVASGTVDRLREALATMTGLDFTPQQYRPHVQLDAPADAVPDAPVEPEPVTPEPEATPEAVEAAPEPELEVVKAAPEPELEVVEATPEAEPEPELEVVEAALEAVEVLEVGDDVTELTPAEDEIAVGLATVETAPEADAPI